MRTATIAILGLAAAAAASAPATAGPARGGPVAEAGLGGVARLGDGVEVRPLAVVEDSRCPRGTPCVWAGRVRLRVRISNMAGTHILEPRQPFRLRRGGTLILLAVEPERGTTRPGGDIRREYRFSFLRDRR